MAFDAQYGGVVIVKVLPPLLAVATLACAFSAQAQAPQAKALQFIDIGQVTRWQPGGARLMYVKAAMDEWYRVDLQEPCMDLFPGKEPRFVTLRTVVGQPYSGVIVERRHCSVTNIAKMDEPPPEKPYVPPKASAAKK